MPVAKSPCASRRPTAMPFGPSAAITIGMSIGRCGAKPSDCRSRIAPPSQSTVSPRRSARSASTYAATSDHFIAFCPRARLPVNPVPMPSTEPAGSQ